MYPNGDIYSGGWVQGRKKALEHTYSKEESSLEANGKTGYNLDGYIRMAQVDRTFANGRSVMDPLPSRTVTFNQENILNRRMTLILRTNLLPFGSWRTSI